MMNKRGEEGGNYTGIIITIIIFALLLVILLVSFSGKSGGIFDSIKSLIPSSWGGVKPGLVEDGAFRYQIMEDKVQYYDGASWREFPVVDINGNKQPGVQIGDKVYVKEDVYNAYRNEYYGDVAPKITVGSLNPVLDYFKMNNPKPVILDVLKQCRILDKLKINKLEMHNPHKHIIIENNKPFLIDFERAYETEKPKNVTQFCQFLMSKKVRSILKYKINKKRLIGLLKKYKDNETEKNFNEIINHFKSIT